MTCDLDRVDALADGRLDGPEAKEVMEHLAGCPQCRAYYEGALAADRVLADTGINPPADFAAGVMERIRPRRQVQWPRAAAGLAACLLLAAGATLALPQAVPEPPSFYREYPELLSSEDQTLVFTLGTKGTDVFEEETRKETEMRYRQLPEESVPVVEDAGGSGAAGHCPGPAGGVPADAPADGDAVYSGAGAGADPHGIGVSAGQPGIEYKEELMKKRTHWFVAAGLALCGLLLAALTLGQPRDVPESSRDNGARPVVRVIPAWKGAQDLEKHAY